MRINELFSCYHDNSIAGHNPIKVILSATEECWVGKVYKGRIVEKNISFSPKGRTVPTAALLDV